MLARNDMSKHGIAASEILKENFLKLAYMQ